MFGAARGNSWATLHFTSISGAEHRAQSRAASVKAVPVLRRTGGGSLLSLADGENLGEWIRHPASPCHPTLQNRVVAKRFASMVHHQYSQIMMLW